MAPDADLIVVKLTGGAPPHGSQSAEADFNACFLEALDWVNGKIALLGQPVAAIANIGVQWGPLDGTSSESRLIDGIFGLDRPGRIYASGTGDEGGLPTHSGGIFNNGGYTPVQFTKAATASADIFAWYTVSLPAEVRLKFADGTTIGPIAPGVFGVTQNGVTVWHYPPGVDPWESTSGDRLIFVRIEGHLGAGSFRMRGLQPGSGRFDLYTPIQSSISFLDHLAPGRINNLAVTKSAVVGAVEVNRGSYVDIDGIFAPCRLKVPLEIFGFFHLADPQETEGWGSMLPWQHIIRLLHMGPDTHWASLRHTLIQDGGGWYGGVGAASASGPILIGAVALMLQFNPTITAREIKQVLHQTSLMDAFTGPTPNPQWGNGKIDMLKVIDAIVPLRKRLTADFDGDGKTDKTVYESRTGNWFFLRSTAGFGSHLNFGGSGFIAVPADYDGDGTSDPAVYQAATGHGSSHSRQQVFVYSRVSAAKVMFRLVEITTEMGAAMWLCTKQVQATGFLWVPRPGSAITCHSAAPNFSRCPVITMEMERPILSYMKELPATGSLNIPVEVSAHT
jgi:hypothetical protein